MAKSPIPLQVSRSLNLMIFGDSSSSSSSSSSFDGTPTAEDQLRWYQQGFRLARNEGYPCGLLQSSGGPCGILATIQAFLLCEVVFGVSAFNTMKDTSTKVVLESGCGGNLHKLATTTSDIAENALAGAIAFAIWQAATNVNGSGVGYLVSLSELDSLRQGVHCEGLFISKYSSYEDLKKGCKDALKMFSTDSGVMLFLYSLLLSRGIETISRLDMDEPGPLVARFGHCTQELLNLAMTGEAVAGVFDGDQGLSSTTDIPIMSSSSPSSSDALKLRGISRRPIIGFLSHIEAMKYSVVGDFLKTPAMPFWLIQSESHLTLVWAAEASANDESPSAPLWKAFKKYEASPDGGFVSNDKLMTLLEEVGFTQLVAVQNNLADKLDPNNIGFIMWSDFWRVMAPLWDVHINKSQEQISNSNMDIGGTETPVSSSSLSKPTSASVADMLETAQSIFMSMDTDGGNFIRSTALKDFIYSVLSNVMGVSFDGASMDTDGSSSSSSSSSSTLSKVLSSISFSEHDVSNLITKLTNGDSIVFIDPILAELEPLFQKFIRSTQKSRHHSTIAAAQTLVSNKAMNQDTGSGSGQTKRQRSDSDVARELQDSFNMSQDDNPTPTTYDTSSGVKRSTTPEHSWSQQKSSTPLIDLTGSTSNNVNPNALKYVRTSDSSDAFLSSSGSGSTASFMQPNLSRNIELFHWNGMFSHSRRPQLTRILLQQRDSGSMQGPINDIYSTDQSLGTTEEQMKKAMELSLAPQVSAIASITPDGRLAPGSALAARAAAAIENILRTKWPMATLAFPDGGVPPSID
jgi:ubiquitin carboxyl-terminal hydrolase MINDY-3/4